MNTTQPLSAQLTGFYNHRTGAPSRVVARTSTASYEEAQAMAARFPKAVRVRATFTIGSGEGAVIFQADLGANGVNGGLNETGLKRLASFRRTLVKLGIELDYVSESSTAYATLQDLDAALKGVQA